MIFHLWHGSQIPKDGDHPVLGRRLLCAASLEWTAKLPKSLCLASSLTRTRFPFFQICLYPAFKQSKGRAALMFSAKVFRIPETLFFTPFPFCSKRSGPRLGSVIVFILGKYCFGPMIRMIRCCKTVMLPIMMGAGVCLKWRNTDGCTLDGL